jgi:hypothetical protein
LNKVPSCPVGEPLAEVTSVVFDGHLVLLDERTGRVLLYSPTGSLIWHALAAGASPAKAAIDLARVFGVPARRIEEDIKHFIEDCEHRLREAAETCSSQTESIESIGWEAGATGNASPLQWRVTLGAITFDLSFERPEWAAALHFPLCRFASPTTAPDVRIEVRETAEGGVSVIENGKETISSIEPEAAFSLVRRRLVENLHPELDWLAMLHAGVVATDGAAILIPGRSGSGKSTLVATLAANDFYYFGDDFAALAVPGEAIPWPVPLSVKEASWRLVGEHYPVLSQTVAFRSRGRLAKQLHLGAASWNIPPQPVKAILFPSYSPAEETAINSITPADALARLLEDRIWLGFPVTREKVVAFLEWLERVPAYEMRYRDVNEAALRVPQLLKAS